MTLRGRLTSAFLVVVLGPVLLGSIFVALAVSAVTRERTAARLDHAATTVSATIGALCRQLQAAADAVAVVPAAERSAVADQLISRGLATAMRLTDPDQQLGALDNPDGWQDCAKPATAPGAASPAGTSPGTASPGAGSSGTGSSGTAKSTVGSSGTPDPSAASPGAASVGIADSGSADSGTTSEGGADSGATSEGGADSGATSEGGADSGATSEGGADSGATSEGGADPGAPPPARADPVTALAAIATAPTVTVTAAQRLDGALLARIGQAAGVSVELTGSPRTGAPDPPSTRHLAAGPGRPLPLTLTAPVADPTLRYAALTLIVLSTALIAILTARWLARSTTRPLGDLAWAADRVANGDLNTRVPIPRPDELRRLAGTFNRMTRELQSYVQALTASRDQLRRHLAILGDTLSSTHDLDRILPVILRTAMTATGARAGLILLAEADGRLAARCGAGLTGEWDLSAAELAQRRLVRGRGVLGTVAASGSPLRGTSGGAPDEPACESYLAVPICAPPNPDGGDEPEPGTLGVLALYDRLGSPDFDDADLRTLRTFAGQAGVAVHNVRVHEEAQRLSLTDPLTGLWNYRYLREVLRREVERASRFGRMLTVLALDLDHFKEVNDTYGHTAGDLVLGEFARRIRVGLREVDVAFRQGGEEFVVLLPETDAYGGVIVAERLGAAVRDRPVPIDPRRPGLDDHISISVSIGIAVFPEHGRTAQEVMDAADEALYAAKNSGRDTYRLAERGTLDSAAATTGGPQPPRQARGR